MKQLKKSIPILLTCLILSSCANVVVNYGNASPNTGNIVVKTNYSLYTNLTLNDSLLINGRLAKTITIKNVPEGINSIHYSVNSQYFVTPLDAKLQVKVEKGKTNTQLITAPPKSNGYWIGQGIALVGLLTMPFWVNNQH